MITTDIALASLVVSNFQAMLIRFKEYVTHQPICYLSNILVLPMISDVFDDINPSKVVISGIASAAWLRIA